jgi:uncharacterized coiled-coil protein SlyX
MNGTWGYIVGAAVTGGFLLAAQIISANSTRALENRKALRESKAREEEARILALERVRAFEHETVADLQTALFEHIRAVQHVIDFDCKQLVQGGLTQMSEDLSNVENESRLRCFFLTHRILNDDLRTSLENFLSSTAQVFSDALSVKIDTIDDATRLRSSLLKSSLALGENYATLQHRLGEEVRAQLVGEFGQVGVIEWRNAQENAIK